VPEAHPVVLRWSASALHIAAKRANAYQPAMALWKIFAHDWPRRQLTGMVTKDRPLSATQV
jgi:hypothetical protein